MKLAIRVLVLALFVACAQRTKLHVDFAFVADLERSGIVRGIITNEAAQPAIGATVVVQRPEGEVVAITDDNGAFVMPQALPEGKYKMVVFWGDKKLERPIEVKAGFVTVVRASGLSEPPGELL